MTREVLRLISLSEESPNVFMRELINPSVSKMLENIISVHDKRYTFDWLTKCVLQDKIAYYNELIDCISKYGIEGYCSKVAEECFGKEFSDSMLPESAEINKQELLTLVDTYASQYFDEEQFKMFVAEFKSKYTAVVGYSNSDNRGKQRQDVGHTWFNNRMKMLDFPYEIAVLSERRYVLLKVK